MITTVRKHLGYVPAAHQLHNHGGLCRLLHGHNYEVEVEVTGEVHPADGQPDEGMVVDFTEISTAWAKIKPFWDHQNLNEVLDDGPAAHEYGHLVGPTTAENLAAWLFHAFQAEGVALTALTLWETPSSSVTVQHEPGKAKMTTLTFGEMLPS